MRFLLAACAALALCWAGAAEAQAARAALVFLPADEELLFDELEARQMALGLTSPSTGGYERAQVFLDISQGTRISNRLYDGDVPRLEVRGNRIAGWEDAVERAEDAPGDLVPGLLGETLRRSGRASAWLGPIVPLGFRDIEGNSRVAFLTPQAREAEAAAAADRRGGLSAAQLARGRRFAATAVRMWPRNGLLVASAPEGGLGLATVDALLRARRAEDIVFVMRAAPPGDEVELLLTGALGPGLRGGQLRSDTTRRDGLLAATDLAPTILSRLGLETPDEMQGQELERVEGDAGELRDLGRRLDVISARRTPVMQALAASWLALIVLLSLGRAGDGLRAGLRIAFLSALWMPGVALLAPVLDPSRLAELLLIVGGSTALGALTDRLAPWPIAPAFPALVVCLAYAVDLAAGSTYTALALTGPNPKGGARFYGIGNELEAMLSLTVLLGAGAGLVTASRHGVPRGFAIAGALAALVLGAGRLGADVGAVITLGAGTAAAVVASLPGRPSRAAIAVAVGVPALAVLALVVIDLATAGGAHLTRSVVEADGLGDLLDIVVRRFELSVSGIGVSSVIAAALLALGVWRRRDIVEPLRRVPGATAFRAGMAGGLAATVVGALANDSGPVILTLGTAALLLAAGYIRGAPDLDRPYG